VRGFSAPRPVPRVQPPTKLGLLYSRVSVEMKLGGSVGWGGGEAFSAQHTQLIFAICVHCQNKPLPISCSKYQPPSI